MDTVTSLIDNIDAPIFQELKTALELGRWESGLDISVVQKDIVIQAIIAYENKHLDETERTGYIHKESQTACESTRADNEEQVVSLRASSKPTL